jgi:hypothetical protein
MYSGYAPDYCASNNVRFELSFHFEMQGGALPEVNVKLLLACTSSVSCLASWIASTVRNIPHVLCLEPGSICRPCSGSRSDRCLLSKRTDISFLPFDRFYPFYRIAFSVHIPVVCPLPLHNMSSSPSSSSAKPR